MLILLMIFAVALLGVAGDILMNEWAKTHLIRWWVMSIPVWVLAATIFGLLLRQKHYTLGVAVVVILLIHSVFVLAWDAVIEKATLAPMQWLGIAAAVVAIILMEEGGTTVGK